MTPPMVRERAGTLRRWNLLTDFITFLLWSAQAKNGKPQSLILVSEPGEGKTELLGRFALNAGAKYLSDLTYRTIISVLRNDVADGPVTHVVCTEFQKVISRRRSVAESTCTFMLQTMDEGIGVVGFGPQTHDCRMPNGEPSRLGWLVATTMTSLAKNPYIIVELAMDSRAYVVDFTATQAELAEIERRMVVGDQSALKKVTLKKLPEGEKPTVDIPPNVSKVARGWVEEMRQKYVRVYGVRTLARFLNTLRGVALANGDTTVKMAHAEELYEFRELWLKPPKLKKDDGGSGHH